jgi:hypothetical protein
MAIAWMTIGVTTTTIQAAAPALQGQVQTRPLTPQDLKDYGLTGVQKASGLATVGIGQPVYLEALVNAGIPSSDITNVSWALTKPLSSVTALSPSPLGTNVPVYKPADRSATKVAGRTMLLPDVAGPYSVVATIRTANSGSTNITVNITAGTYMGIETCSLCHYTGAIIVPPNKQTVEPWSHTLHATKFAREINGGTDPATSHYSKNCISCHTVGYDTSTNAVNGGFDDVATQLGWTFPTNLNAPNWEMMQTNYPDLANLANIQCESCHGPGSEHAYGLGAANKISIGFGTGDCAQCHDSKNNHSRVAEWKNSRHAVSTRTPSGPNRINCVRCHTAMGFEQFIEHAGSTNLYATNTVYEAITCAACHDPHDATHPHQLRAANTYTLPEGTTVTNVGLGALCMTCHHSRNGSAVTNIANYQQGKPTWAGGSSFGPHDSTAGDMIEGVNGITYGKFIPSGAHSYTITNVCVGCHMQPVATTDPAFTKAGGHTFSMTYLDGTNTIDKVDVCVKCHGPIQHFDMVRKDYNSDGLIEGIQTEVQKLLNEVNALLPDSTYRADGNYVADGNPTNSVSVKTNWPTKFLNAAWNYQFVNVEGSHGIHNAPYAIGLLKASIADLTDDIDHDGLSDTWEIANYGVITVTDGNADSDNDGANNALELAAGTNPKLADSDGDGISDWAELQAGSDPTNANDKPGFVVKIEAAGELEFASEVGKTYRVEMVSENNSAWEVVTPNMPGTGQIISVLVSTKHGPSRAFYRVVQVVP